jgi:tetratricopeptide (TPR) repeat protein
LVNEFTSDIRLKKWTLASSALAKAEEVAGKSALPSIRDELGIDRAELLLDQGKTPSALALLEHIKRRFQKKRCAASLVYLVGRCHDQLSEKTKAEEEYKEALSIAEKTNSGDRFDIALSLEQLLKKQGRLQEAQAVATGFQGYLKKMEDGP